MLQVQKWKTSSYLTFLHPSSPPPSNLSIKFSYFACTAYTRLSATPPCRVNVAEGGNQLLFFYFPEMPVNRNSRRLEKRESSCYTLGKKISSARGILKQKRNNNNNNNLHRHDFIRNSECEKERGESVFNATK